MNCENPHAIIQAFKAGYELEETYWTYRSLYLSSAKQAKGESAAVLATRVEDLVNLCRWPDAQKETRHIDLFYHLTDFFDVQRFVQNEAARDSGNLTWEKLVEEAKHQECVGKDYARFRRENSGGGTPSSGDPALAADTMSWGFKRPQQAWTPSGGKQGRSQKQCDWYGRRNGCNGEKGTCPAWGKECGFCHNKNYYKAACHKVAQQQQGGGAQYQKQGKGKSPGKSGKSKAKHTHSVVFKTVPAVKGVVFEREERAPNSVTSEPSVPLSKAANRCNPVLSGKLQSKTSLKSHNMFSCDSIHDTGEGSLDHCKTDTDPSGRLCIMADILIRATIKSTTHNIRVKADPGADANLMPIHHFRQIFPYLCDSSGQPKEGVLEKAESSFES